MKRLFTIKRILTNCSLALLGLIGFATTAFAYNVTLPQQCNTTTGGSEVMIFTGTSACSQTGATLTIEYAGDLNSGGEIIDFYGEGNTFLGTSAFINQCTGVGTITFNLTAAQITAWAANGSVEITADAANGVNALSNCVNGQTNSFCVTGTLDYTCSIWNDAALTAALPELPTCVLDSNVYGTVTNFGINTLDSLTVNWSVNGVLQDSLNWQGPLGTGVSDNPLFLGNYNFNEGDTLTIWTSNFNEPSTTDFVSSNDTFSVVLRTGLVGTYTVDGSGNGDYASFNDALADAEVYGLCGPVVFQSVGGTYNETLQLTDNIPNHDAVNTITFRGSTGNPTADTLTAVGQSSENFVISMENASNYRFEDLTIWNPSSAYGTVIRYLGGSSNNNRVDNCHLISGGSNTSTNNAVIFSSTNIDSGNVFTNNSIIGGSYGMYWYGTNTSTLEEGTVIENNNFLNQYFYGIRVYYQDAVQINENYFRSNVTYTNGYGIYTYYCDNDQSISGNHIDPQNDWPRYGIYLNYNDAVIGSQGVVANNKVHLGVSGNGSSRYGIYVRYSGFQNIHHNTVAVGSSSNASRGFYIFQGGSNSLMNNISEMTVNGLALEIENGPAVAFGDRNNLRSNGNNLAELSGTFYNTLADWSNGTGYDTSSFNVNPQFNNLSELRPCNDTLDGSALQSVFVDDDFDGQGRSVTPDLGADEFTALSNWSLGADTGLCDGSTVMLEALYSDTAIWSTANAVLDTSNTYTVTNPNTYYVNAVTGCGNVTDSIIVEGPATPNMASDTNICFGEVGMIGTAYQNGSYMWNNGETTSMIQVEDAGTYKLTLVDQWGCVSVDSTVVTESPLVDLGEDTLALCENGVVFLDAQIPGSYNWSTGSTNQTITVQNDGMYAVTVTDQFNCISEDSTYAEITPLPTVSFTDSTVWLTSQFFINQVGAENVVWDFGDGTFSTDLNPIHVWPWPGGPFQVTVTISNDCGTASYTQVVNSDVVNSVTELNNGEVNITAYPNPTNGMLNIGINGNLGEEVTLEIHDIQGRVVTQRQLGAVHGVQLETFDLSSEAKGIYFVRATIGQNVENIKVTVQ